MIPNQQLAIDVSNNNPIHAGELQIAKPALLICKATEGTGYQDPTYANHRGLAHNAGIQFGSYLFLHPKSSGSEADYFMEYAKPTVRDVIAVDVETSDGASMQDVAKRALTCLQRLRAVAPSDPLLYCSSSWWKTLTEFEPNLKSFAVWEAQYPGKFTQWAPILATLRVKLRSGATVKLWQWTDHYKIGNRYFDASRIFGGSV